MFSMLTTLNSIFVCLTQYAFILFECCSYIKRHLHAICFEHSGTGHLNTRNCQKRNNEHKILSLNNKLVCLVQSKNDLLSLIKSILFK